MPKLANTKTHENLKHAFAGESQANRRYMYFARRLRKARVHLRVLVGLAFDGRLEVLLGVADRHIGHRVADLLEEIEMTKRMAGLGFRGIAEQTADVGISLDIGAPRKVEIAPVRLRLAPERLLQVLVRLRTLQCLRHGLCLQGECVGRVSSCTRNDS